MTRWFNSFAVWAAVPSLLHAGDVPAAKWLVAPTAEPAAAADVPPIAASVTVDPRLISMAYAALALAAGLLLLGRLVAIARARGFVLPRLSPVRLRRQDDPLERLAQDARRR
ncbi:hypothetical protein [Rhodovulum euryhalinum]|uniref:Uncharacterized protein n=1 Tax=Rhodovulum euryhalinum TaxID=35805 RepID=A0A4R2K9D9_9RHOB|nr:hypothetical protein [Rhodovulum euryhalinum]TCO68742.1 hypothetical protein EV655_1244 [Rhodovulum euryhalinum]